MAQSARVPTVKAMLACQRVLKEEGTGLVSVIGIFQTITAKSLPLTLPSVFVFASLTDAQGEYLFRLEIVRQSDEKKIAEVTLPSVSVEDPMANGEMTVELNGLTFDEAGAYEFRLWANDRFLANTAMAIALVQSREEGDHESRED